MGTLAREHALLKKYTEQIIPFK